MGHLSIAIARRALATGLLALAGLLGAGQAAAQSFNLYVYSPVNTSATSRGQIAMVNQIDKETNGQLKIKMHLGGSLPIQANNISAAVADNVVQMADDTFQSGMIPLVEALRLPRLYRNYQETQVALKIMEPYIRREYDKRGILMLAAYVYPEQVLWSRNKLTSLADLKNQKIRITAPSQGSLLRLLGASPVTLGTAEVAAALERGVIDGVVTASSGAAFIFKDLLKSSYRFNVGFGQSYLVVNKETFQKLPPATQAIVQNAATAAYKSIDEMLLNDDAAMTEKLKTGGIVTIAALPSDDAEAERLSTPLWDEWAKKTGPEAVEMLKKIRDALGR